MTVFYCNVYELPDGTQFVGPQFLNRHTALTTAMFPGVRRVGLLRIATKR